MTQNQARIEALLNGVGQATEAMTRVAQQTSDQQQQVIAAMQRMENTAAQAQAAPAQAQEFGPANRAVTPATPFDTGGKILKAPLAFSPAAIEEEVSQWGDWSFRFKNFLAFMDHEFLYDLKKAEAEDDTISSAQAEPFFAGREDRRVRGMKLYSVLILSSYLRNRPLKVLRSVQDMNGFEAWRRLSAELEPSSTSRSLAMAQALGGFPAMTKVASLMDYVLTYEKLVNEYEKLTSVQYDDNLKIGALLQGIPSNLKQHIMVDITERTTKG